MLLDLALTIYIIIQLAGMEVFACCADNKTLNSNCAYTEIGGAKNVGVDSEGYCIQKSTSTDCKGELATCAADLMPSVNMTTLCSQDTLDEVANSNWDWLMAVLVIKAIGLVFLIVLEIRSLRATCRSNREPGEEDVQATTGCYDKFKHCSWNCCKSCMKGTTIFTLKIFFLIFGIAATSLAIWLLWYTDHVTFSSCNLLDGQLETNCNLVEESCTYKGGQNYYVVVFSGLELTGPYVVDLITSISTTVVWIVRFAVLRYYLNQSKLAEV